MRTWLMDTLGLTVPVVCAPMTGVAGGSLAAAVSRAGALGMVGVGATSTTEWITAECRIAAATGGSFGVGLQAWVLDTKPDQLDAVLAAKPALVSVSYGSYAKHVSRIHDAGRIVATTVANLQEAREAEAAGVDVIVARGAEGGGHGRADVGTLPLLQSVLEVVATPVLAAGGIGTSRGLAAVVAAGAAGAWAGTAFLTCIEGSTSPASRSRLIAAMDTDTVYGRVFDIGKHAGWPGEFGERALRNDFYDRWHGKEEELARDDAAAKEIADAQQREDYDTACLDAGNGVGLLRRETSAAEVIAEFANADRHLRAAGTAP